MNMISKMHIDFSLKWAILLKQTQTTTRYSSSNRLSILVLFSSWKPRDSQNFKILLKVIRTHFRLSIKPILFPRIRFVHLRAGPPANSRQPFMESSIMILHNDTDQYLMILIILLSSVRIKNIESITLNLWSMKNWWCYIPHHLQNSSMHCEKSQ